MTRLQSFRRVIDINPTEADALSRINDLDFSINSGGNLVNLLLRSVIHGFVLNALLA